MTDNAPFRPFRLDLSLDDARPASARVTEGFYLLECEGCDQPTQTKTSTGVRVLYHIVQGPDHSPNLGLGGKMRDFNTLESPGRERTHFAFTATLVALGRPDIVEAFARMGEQNVIDSPAKLASVIAQVSSAIKGRRCVADIRDRQGTQNTYSSIEALFPESDWDTFRKAVTYGGGAQQPGPGFAQPAQPRPNGPAPSAAGADLFADLDRAI